MLIEQYLPEFDVRKRHSRFVRAPQETVHAALESLRVSEISPVVALLFAMRELPSRIVGRRPPDPQKRHRPLLEDMVADGFVRLASTPGELVLGLAGEPWKLVRPRLLRLGSAIDFQQLEDATLAKIVMNLSLEPVPGGTMLATETRVRVPDERARRRFLRYWFCIRLGSGLIRVLWLRAAERKALGLLSATRPPDGDAAHSQQARLGGGR